MLWESLTQDLRYTFRTLCRDAGFFTVAVMIIALGIGANTAIFSVVNGLLFRPLQIRAEDRLVWIENAGGGPGLSCVTSRVSTFLERRKQSRSFEELAACMTFLLGGFAAGALLLAIIGIYGAVSYSVTQRM